MRILYVPICGPNAFQLGTARALMALGEVQFINYLAWYETPVPFKHFIRGLRIREYLRSSRAVRNGRQVLLQAVRKFRPDVIHMQIQQESFIVPDLLRAVRREFPNVILSHWTGDRRQEIPDNLLECARVCNVTFAASYSYVQMFRAAGCNAYYLQHSFEPHEHYPRDVSRDIPVVYLGNLRADRSFPGVGLRLDVAGVVRDLGGKVFGTGWPEGLSAGSVAKFNGAGEVYSRAKIAVNLNHFTDDMMYQSDRWFHAAACGAFTLSYRHPGIEYILEDGKHTVFFESAKELAGLIAHYQQHDEERQVIARQGMEFCLAHHNRDCRVRDLLRVWNCPVRGLEHETLPQIGQAEADLVASQSKGRILDMGASMRNSALSRFSLYTSVDGDLPAAQWRESILKLPFHSGIFDTVTLHFSDGTNWHLALEEAQRLASRLLIVFSAPPGLAVPSFKVRYEDAHLLAIRSEDPIQDREAMKR
jgi:glycosyl transferase family 1